jgi:hypothetical protein
VLMLAGGTSHEDERVIVGMVNNVVKFLGEKTRKCAQNVKSKDLKLTPLMQIGGVLNKCSDVLSEKFM